MKNKKGFISINSTGSSDIPVNLETITNTSSTPQNFSAFKGKGVAVGTSDTNTTRENVNYANLTSRSQEEITSNESRLELNNNTQV